MSGFDAQHTAVDVEKGAHGAHHNHSNGSVANGNSHYSSQEGGAPLNLRNITPGGHPLDRVSFSLPLLAQLAVSWLFFGPLSKSQPAFPTYHRRFANPAPLGLCGFAL